MGFCNEYSDIGDISVVANQASLPTGSARYPGKYVYISNADRTVYWNGVGWVIMSEPAQTWVPTWTQGATISKSVGRATYTRSDGRCRGDFTMTATSSGTTANPIVSSIPINADGVGFYGTHQLFISGTFRSGPMYRLGGTAWGAQADGIATSALNSPAVLSGDIFWAMFDYPMVQRHSF